MSIRHILCSLLASSAALTSLAYAMQVEATQAAGTAQMNAAQTQAAQTAAAQPAIYLEAQTPPSAVAGQAALEHHTAHPGRYGLHGMLLFSDGQALYASHLPMFHRPHDVQLILRVSFNDRYIEQQLIHELWQAPNWYWTLEPELFELNRFDNNRSGSAAAALTEFNATLYQGHFERGGRAHQAVRVQVHKVVLFRPLLPAAAPSSKHASDQIANRTVSPPAQLQRVAQQAEGCVYLHLIGNRPGYDQLLQVKHQKGAPSVCPLRLTTSITAPASLTGLRQQIPATRVRTIYLETADLR